MEKWYVDILAQTKTWPQHYVTGESQVQAKWHNQHPSKRTDGNRGRKLLRKNLHKMETLAMIAKTKTGAKNVTMIKRKENILGLLI